MPRLFGTDGVRGLANRDLTPDLAVKLGNAAGRVLGRIAKQSENHGRDRLRAIIANDSRVSGSFLTLGVSAGLLSAGVNVNDIGIIPTPGVAYLSKRLNVDLGVMISASHNPMEDNGIKFFTSEGFKLADAIEDEIESALDENWQRPTGRGVGRFKMDAENSVAHYTNYLVSSIASSKHHRPLEGLKITMDCANGASSIVAPSALRMAGAEVSVINASPDGYNINLNAGSTHPELLQAFTKNSDADFGVAFDGDADRCMAVDADGEIVDGDKILAILAKDKKNAGTLAKDTVVVTVMSNKGFLDYMADLKIATPQTAVGDRYVLEEMLRNGYNFGGEQSGHIINLDKSTTGDGTLTALSLANAIKNSGKSLKELAAEIERYPQYLVNVSGVDKSKIDDTILQKAIQNATDELGSNGRVLLRSSGTEPLIRVMVEAKNDAQAARIVEELAQKVKERLSLEKQD